MDRNNTPPTPGELPQPSSGANHPLSGTTTTANASSPLPPHSLLEATPSNTTATLPTPDAVHVQLASVECRNPPRFIFYPISWDGSEDPPAQSKLTVPPNLTTPDIQTDYIDDDQLYSPSAVFCYTDTFWSIDRWRRDVVKYDDSAVDLLDPIQDADVPLPLLSFPHDHPQGLPRNTEHARPHPVGTGSGSSEDEVQLWIHP